jgi:hypothetical protein
MGAGGAGHRERSYRREGRRSELSRPCITTAAATLRPTALAELDTTSISGTHGRARGWALSNWLVAHAARLGVEQVSFGGDTWTASSGKWSSASAATDVLSLREVADSRS